MSGVTTEPADPLISAVVILRPSSGVPLGSTGPVTVATIEGSLPAPDAVARVQAWFREAGFAVSEPGAVDVSIAGQRTLFERVFTTTLTVEGDDVALDVVVAGTGRELPLASLPADVQALIEAVAFTEPPAFGPGGDGP